MTGIETMAVVVSVFSLLATRKMIISIKIITVRKKR